MKLKPEHVQRLELFLDRLADNIYPEPDDSLPAEITERMTAHLVEHHAPRPGGRVLDVGCGRGLGMRAFRDRGFEVVGLTRGSDDRALCEREGFHVIDADPSFTDLPDAGFDVLWCRHFLEHSPFPLFTLCEMRRLLRDDGILYVEVPAPDTSCAHERNPNHYSVLGRSMWVQLITRAGFTLLESVDLTFMTGSGPDTYWAFICGPADRVGSRPAPEEPQVAPADPLVCETAASAWLCLPVDGGVGWGVCGRSVAREMSAMAVVRLASPDLDSLDDPFDRDALAPLRPPEPVVGALRAGRPVQVAAPVLHAIEGISLQPLIPLLRGSRQVGYTFFESAALPAASIENARRHFDVVAAGSTWCADVLRAHGLARVETVVQGVDPAVFEPSRVARTIFRHRFAVFSGGKLELRKGQDLVIRAFAALARKYDDMLLVAAWSNPWDFSVATMAGSPYIRFEDGPDFRSTVERTAAANGIRPEQLVVVPPMPHERLARLYKNTDVGLFPNRCEGGTNLVLMEYMACGRPVIASFNTGHRDVITPANALPVFDGGRLVCDLGGGARVEWDDPSLDEIIARLEWAYLHRDKLGRLGRRGARDIGHLTWTRTARQLLDLLQA